jgi:hypothetical protein
MCHRADRLRARSTGYDGCKGLELPPLALGGSVTKTPRFPSARRPSLVRPERPFSLRPGCGGNRMVTGHQPEFFAELPLLDLPTGRSRP